MDLVFWLTLKVNAYKTLRSLYTGLSRLDLWFSPW